MNQVEFERVYKKIKNVYFAEISYWESDKPYYDGLANAFKGCKVEVFEKAVEKHISISKKTPTVADLREIIGNMQRPVANHTDYETTPCKLCGGVGLISYYRWNRKTGFWCEYLCHCSCQNNERFAGNKAFLTAGQVDELIVNTPYVRLNVPYGMHMVPPEAFEQAMKELKAPRIDEEKADRIRQEILSRRKTG